MKILGIETSCDETSAAVVENGTKIISLSTASSQSIHAKFGGIIPEKAAREQISSIIPVLDESLHQAGVKTGQGLDAIAVTFGPGLVGSLLVGIEAAKSLSFVWHKPLIPVNHLIGHFYSAWLEGGNPRFPIVSLIVSGGHTELILAKDHGRYQHLGGTRDDAAGEAFDKVARFLGLGYPGGPEIEKAAAKGNPSSYPMPRPLINSGDLDFSFSGLKTHITHLASNKRLNKEFIANISASFQSAVVDVLLKKTKQAFITTKAKSVVICGGVAANSLLRERAAEIFGETLYLSSKKLAVDNAAMIASAAYFNYKPLEWEKVKAEPSLLF